MRKNYFVNKKFQIQMAYYSLSIIAVTGISVVGSIYFFIKSLLEDAESVGATYNPEYLKFVNNIKESILFNSSISLLVVTVFVIIISVLLSHKIAGPLYKLNDYLNQVADDPSRQDPISFRKNDFFSELAESTNRALNKVKNNEK